jgi:uncharacterized protein YggT (Ycf19 family)
MDLNPFNYIPDWGYVGESMNHLIDPYMETYFEKMDRVQCYYTQQGVEIWFLNRYAIWEFPTTLQAYWIAYFRWCLVDAIRYYNILVSLRFTLQMFGTVNPYDGRWFQTLYEMSGWLVKSLQGVLPNIFGWDLSIFFTFAILERAEHILVRIAIVDSLGNRF